MCLNALILKNGEQPRPAGRIFSPPLNDRREEDLFKVGQLLPEETFFLQPSLGAWSSAWSGAATRQHRCFPALLRRDRYVPSSTSSHQLFAPKRVAFGVKSVRSEAALGRFPWAVATKQAACHAGAELPCGCVEAMLTWVTTRPARLLLTQGRRRLGSLSRELCFWSFCGCIPKV